MTPAQQHLLDLVLSLDGETVTESFAEANAWVTRPRSQGEFIGPCAGIWWPRQDDRLQVLLLDPLDWRVDAEWLFGCRSCGRAEGWIERLPNGCGFCLDCWAKGEQNRPVFAGYCHPFDWVVMRGGAKPLHPSWFYHTFNVFHIQGIPAYLAGWGEWLPRTEIADWQPHDDWGADWKFREGWREKVSGREWGIVNLDGLYLAETTTWNHRERAIEDNEEVTVFRVGCEVGSAAAIDPDYQRFPDLGD